MNKVRKIGDKVITAKQPLLVTHVGVTYAVSTPEDELKKALVAVENGVDIISDASLGEKSRKTLKLLCDNIKVPVTALPGYYLATDKNQNFINPTLSRSQILEVTEELLSYGIKGFTTHSSFRREHMHLLNQTDRVFSFTSRMGNYIREYMGKTGKENPFYEYFPDIIKLAKKYNSIISLGVVLRSPSVANNGGFDELFKQEILASKELIQMCHDQNVDVLLEAGGHIALDKMQEWYDFIKVNCDNVPIRALTVSTDRGMGHDNVSGAIAAAFMARIGVEVICITTRSEHISQPSLEDIRESVVNFKIALASAKVNYDLEHKVANARARGGCHLPEVLENIIDPEGARKVIAERFEYREESDLENCTMCGLSCPLKWKKSS